MVDNLHTYEGLRRSVSINEKVWRVWQEHRQIQSCRPEAFGVLIGSTSDDRRDIYVEDVTTPRSGDCKYRNSFDLQDPGHQQAVDTAHRHSDGSQIYLGTWHTHPQQIPSPSGIDKVDWRRCLRRNGERSLIFVIAGTERTSVFVPWRWWFQELKELKEVRG